jgi:hypothetical protein
MRYDLVVLLNVLRICLDQPSVRAIGALLPLCCFIPSIYKFFRQVLAYMVFFFVILTSKIMYRIQRTPRILPSKIINKPPENTFLPSHVKLARIYIHGAFKISPKLKKLKFKK